MSIQILSFLQHLQQWCLAPTCVLCGHFTKRSLDVCVFCEKELPWLTQACSQCALPLPADTPMGQKCGHCLQHPPPFEKTLALFHYQTPIDRLITRLKFQQRLTYAKLIGTLFAKQLSIYYQTHKLPECIIPMPLHKTRLRERGFNQAVELAKPLSKQFGIKLDRKSCVRIRATQAQTQIPAKEREQNVKNAFYIHPNLQAKHVAILDDVVTTGHTITELSYALKKAGVEQIDVWCCARTSKL
jgi:ComF family protein